MRRAFWIVFCSIACAVLARAGQRDGSGAPENSKPVFTGSLPNIHLPPGFEAQIVAAPLIEAHGVARQTNASACLDDYGRRFYFTNNFDLLVDLVPAHYSIRNRHFPAQVGLGVKVTGARLDGRPAGLIIYRGDQFPPSFRGNLLVCEPEKNLVRRLRLIETNLTFAVESPPEGEEFLRSTQGGFHPISLANGPDGALDVIDRGENAASESAGRIIRVVYAPNARGASSARNEKAIHELIAALSSPNAWRRESAQASLIEANSPATMAALRALLQGDDNEFATLHALAILGETGRLAESDVRQGFNSKFSKTRVAALRAAELLIKRGNAQEVVDQLLRFKPSSIAEEWQLLLTLGEIRSAKAEQKMLGIASQRAEIPLFREAAISGLPGRELEFIELLLSLPAWSGRTEGGSEFIGALAQCVWVEASPERIHRWLELVQRESAAQLWRAVALLDGPLQLAGSDGAGKRAGELGPVRLPAEPAVLAQLRQNENAQIKEKALQMETLLDWPGKPQAKAAVKEPPPLSPEEQERFRMGKTLYVTTCGACHQPHGRGQAGLAPPLIGSEWAQGPVERLGRIVLQGLRGPIVVQGQEWNHEMPPMAILGDEELAALLTYIRREWGHAASPVAPETIARIREATKDREEPWTVAELLKIK